jgi:hypothetical protein
VRHVAPSKLRIASLGDYLVSVSKSIVVERLEVPTLAMKPAARKRLSPLMILNDVLHHDKHHQRRAASGIFGKESMSFIPELIELAAAYMPQKESEAEKKLRAMLNLWALNHYVGTDDIKSLQDRTDEALFIAQGGAPVRKRNYLLPEYHGDRNAPWYDLPASYMLDQMIKHPNRPIDGRGIKVAKFDKKPVSPLKRKLLDEFFENIDLKHVPTGENPDGETKKHKLWRDPMGQIVKQNKETGETVTVYNGYGWSMKFCRDMQKDGVPEKIRIAREDARREAQMEQLRPAPQLRTDGRRYSASMSRPVSSSSDSDFRRGRDSRGTSRSSHESRSYVRPRSQSRRQTSSRPEHSDSRDRGRDYNDRDRDYNNRERDQQRPPSRSYDNRSSSSGKQWNGPDGPRRNQGISNNNQYAAPPPNFTQGYSQPPSLPFSAPPPPPQQFHGQMPTQPFPPPPPFQPGAFPGGILPPPPLNFSGSFAPPMPNMAAMPQNPYNFGGHQPGNNAYGNNGGYGQNSGQGQYQGNFPGNPQGSFQGNFRGNSQGNSQGNFQNNPQGGRGGHRGNYQGGGYNNRGGHGGQQRGQRGGRW